ncbi:NUDIX hydrolase [Thauera sp. Sel9]|uniref:NUDIX hydrolase n=1 Tax=Thauera sp. Sel9 TaxID=2974299 RepID=UPI0021E160BB|nr:NUDIX domain-containing protein [Thauera sp. Sel9]MCV2216602.1 NUDIX domain-containing protein [Thauera sp. Sel9]
MTPTKSCPVLLRRGDEVEILAFQHPIAGFQLVKGSIEEGESPEEAAIRELAEESGIQAARISTRLGVWESGHQGQIWSFHLCEADLALPDQWVHHAADDGGHDFRFFWHPLSKPAGSEWHEVFQRALKYIHSALTYDTSSTAKTSS